MTSLSTDISLISDVSLNSASQVNLDTERQRMQNLSQISDPNLKEKEMREACEGFESIFIQQILEQMRATLPQSDLLKSKEQEHWQSMFDEELAKSFSSAGGIGLADMMMEQLTRQESASSTPDRNLGMSQASKESSNRRAPMNVAPASLMNEITAPPKSEGASPSVYDSNAPSSAQMANSATQLNTPNAQLTQLVSTQAGSLYEETSAHVGTTNQNAGSVNKALGELQAMVDAKAPQVTRTVYTTNLPANERKAALFDDPKDPILDLQRSKEAQDNSASQQNQRNQSNQPGSLVSFANNTSQTNIQSNQSAQTGSTPEPNIDLDPLLEMASYPTDLTTHPELKKEVPVDILAGIRATYVPYSDRAYSSPIVPERNMEPTRPIIPQDNSTFRGQEMYVQASPTGGGTQVAQSQTTQTAQTVQPIQTVQTVQGRQVIQAPQANPVDTKSTLTSQKLLANLDNASIQSSPTQNTGGAKIIRSVGQSSGIQASPAMAPANGSMQMPIDGEVTSVFGWRIDPFTGQRAWHTGLDIKATEGSSVRAAQDGTVIFAGEDEDFGNMIILDHGNGIQSIYAHNSSLQVSEGMEVSLGTEIASVGSSGRAYGKHLHFEVRQSDLPINPEPLLRQGIISIVS